VRILERTVDGQPGLVAQLDGVTVTVYAFDIADDKITHIWAILKPDKLRPWTTGWHASPCPRVRCQRPMPGGNSMPGTEIRLFGAGDADAIAAHRARGAGAFARCEPSRPGSAAICRPRAMVSAASCPKQAPSGTIRLRCRCA
jgi:hypothetical protein